MALFVLMTLAWCFPISCFAFSTPGPTNNWNDHNSSHIWRNQILDVLRNMPSGSLGPRVSYFFNIFQFLEILLHFRTVFLWQDGNSVRWSRSYLFLWLWFSPCLLSRHCVLSLIHNMLWKVLLQFRRWMQKRWMLPMGKENILHPHRTYLCRHRFPLQVLCW